MPALVSDIAAASRDVVQAEWSSATIAARYSSARDGSATPAEGFFDAVADAQTVINARGALIGTERRRFTAKGHIVWPDLSSGVPTYTLIDAEQQASLSTVQCRIEIDLDAERMTLELFG